MNSHPTEAFIEAVDALVGLSQEARQHLSTHLNVRRFDPRQLLLQKGHAFEGIFFIHAGLVRGLYDDANGMERSAWFLAEGDSIPPVYMTYNSSTDVYTAYAPGGNSDYKWVGGNGELDNGAGGGSSANSFTLSSGSGSRC